MQFKERIDFFSSQTYDHKKQQVFSLLETIQDKHQTIKELYINIRQLKKIPDEILIEVYTDILNLEKITIKEKEEKAIEKLGQTNIYIKQLRQKEEAERIQENPEGNLENALDQLF